MRTAATATGAALLLSTLALAARADDHTLDEDGPRVTGEFRAGWRWVSGEGRGRFRQDSELRDGPRLFDAHLLYEPAETEPVESVTLDAGSIGDPSPYASVRVQGRGDWRVDASHRLTDHSYRASGDPFPYETLRKRSHVEFRAAPSRRLSLRLRWDRNAREGTSFASTDTDIRELPAPPGVDGDLVRTRRPFGYRLDRYEVGADLREGAFRFGLAQRLDVRTLSDERFYEIPPDRRGADAVREAFDRTQRGTNWTTTAKIGATLLDGDLDLSAIGGYAEGPLESRVRVDQQGFDNEFAAAQVRGAFRGRRDARHRTRRLRRTWRLEGVWTPHDDVELVAFGEGDDAIDDARLRIRDRRVYERPDLGTRTTFERSAARISDRTDRYGMEAAWQATDAVRLRAGHEWAVIDLEVPTDSPGGSLSPTDLHSNARRLVLGLDFDPDAPFELDLLARIARDDEPQSTASFERGDEWIARLKLRPGGSWSVTGAVRSKSHRREERLDSATRSDSYTLSGSWSTEPWTVSGTVQHLRSETRTEIRFFELDGFVFRRTRGTARFRTEDSFGSLDVRYAASSRLSAFARASVVRSSGDYSALSHEAAIGLDYELDDTWAAGLVFRSLRLAEDDLDRDDYRAEALELSLTYSF